MGILFGGWAREMEEEVNERFAGDWDAYRRHHDEIARRCLENAKPTEYSASEPHVCAGDIIAKWDYIANKAVYEWHVDEIKDGEIYGREVSYEPKNDGKITKWDDGDYVKVNPLMREL